MERNTFLLYFILIRWERGAFVLGTVFLKVKDESKLKGLTIEAKGAIIKRAFTIVLQWAFAKRSTHGTLTPVFGGSNPSRPAIWYIGAVG